MGAMTTCGTKRRATGQSAMVATLTYIFKRACKQGCPSGRSTSGKGHKARAAVARRPGATGKRHRRQTQPRAAGQRSCGTACLEWWTAPGKWPQSALAKGAQRPEPQTDRRQLEQDNPQLVTFLPNMAKGRGPRSITTEWMAVGPCGSSRGKGGGRGRATVLRTNTVGLRRVHLRFAIVVPGAWWATRAASWMRAKTVWTIKAAAK